AHVVWMSERPMFPGRQYLLRTINDWIPVSATSIRYRVDVNSREQVSARKLDMNEIGFCHFSTARAFPFDPYASNRTMGSFILVDRECNDTAAAGTLAYPLHRASNVQRHPLLLDAAARAAMKGQTTCILWFTGLSGAGKSSITSALERALFDRGCHTYVL